MVNKSQQQEEQDEKLGGEAREAKERLDERLRSQYRKLEPKRYHYNFAISELDHDICKIFNKFIAIRCFQEYTYE